MSSRLVSERWGCGSDGLHHIRNPRLRGQSSPLVLDRINRLAMNPLRDHQPSSGSDSPRSITPKTGGTPEYWDQPVPFPEGGRLLELEPLESHVRYRPSAASTPPPPNSHPPAVSEKPPYRRTARHGGAVRRFATLRYAAGAADRRSHERRHGWVCRSLLQDDPAGSADRPSREGLHGLFRA